MSMRMGALSTEWETMMTSATVWRCWSDRMLSLNGGPVRLQSWLRLSAAELTWFGDLCNSFIPLVVSTVVVPSAPERLDVAHPGGRGQDIDVVGVHIVEKTAVNVVRYMTEERR